MTMTRRSVCLISAVILSAPVCAALAQSAAPAANSYDPRLTFAPLTLPEPVNSYRSGNGAPGPAYWQNEADYEMHATLDTAAKVLTNDEVITYTNNSPDTLTSLWVMLEQNTYRKDSRARLMNGGDRDQLRVLGRALPHRPEQFAGRQDRLRVADQRAQQPGLRR